MSETSSDEPSKRSDFTCGVVEGFYGRPWTTDQRKDLFQKLKKWGMDMYVYAPKDDYKHRAYWRELYTVEEAEHLTSLISAAKEQGITFCYALSPGLDITYSNQKEITILKRKLEQVSQFGSTCFALLFDDIEPEMSEADKQIFQSFAHAQVSITNEIHQHLGCPHFLLCPTQYCSTRAVPTVSSSEYLNTLGSKLNQSIDIMWTGPKVISKTLTTDCIEEITRVLRRPPVIWDNLHANDYDQKRLFLGPYCGRSPELIPLLRGVLTNPNCEYNANMIPISTLAHWARCSLDAPQQMEAVSWDIKLERESEQGVCDDDAPLSLGKNVYHHRHALRQSIAEWLPEFSIPKAAQGPVTKPQAPTLPPVPIIPILPSVNTCMSLVTPTSNTCTSVQSDMRSPSIPTVSTSQLAQTKLSTSSSSSELTSPSFSPVMNSLVSPTKVVLNESIPNPIIPIVSSNISIPSELPISTLPVPILGIKLLDEYKDSCMSDKNESTDVNCDEMKKEKSDFDQIVLDDEVKVDEHRNGDMSVGDTPKTLSPSRGSLADGTVEPLDIDGMTTITADNDVMMQDAVSENGSMQVEPSHSPLSTDMMVEPIDSVDTIESDDNIVTTDVSVDDLSVDPSGITSEDLVLLCDLFYLPFEHGARGLRLLHDYHWLCNNVARVLRKENKPELNEWRARRCRFTWWVSRTKRLQKRLSQVPNKELSAEINPYVWDLSAVISLLDGFLRWFELGKFPPNVASNLQGSYTWFSKGWREAFESGAQEPWVFRGGLSADLRRLLPVECSGHDAPSDGGRAPFVIRPYRAQDEQTLCDICYKSSHVESDSSKVIPGDLKSLPADRLLIPFLTYSPELCMILESDDDGYLRDSDISASDEGENENQINCEEAIKTEKLSRLPNASQPDVVGYACAAINSKELQMYYEMSWLAELRTKYPITISERPELSDAVKGHIAAIHSSEDLSLPERLLGQHPAVFYCDAPVGAAPRLAAALLAALKANGVRGAHAFMDAKDNNAQQLYTRLGFTEVHRVGNRMYMARTF